jgi:hypothetical protein
MNKFDLWQRRSSLTWPKRPSVRFLIKCFLQSKANKENKVKHYPFYLTAASGACYPNYKPSQKMDFGSRSRQAAFSRKA